MEGKCDFFGFGEKMRFSVFGKTFFFWFWRENMIFGYRRKKDFPVLTENGIFMFWRGKKWFSSFVGKRDFFSRQMRFLIFTWKRNFLFWQKTRFFFWFWQKINILVFFFREKRDFQLWRENKIFGFGEKNAILLFCCLGGKMFLLRFWWKCIFAILSLKNIRFKFVIFQLYVRV